MTQTNPNRLPSATTGIALMVLAMLATPMVDGIAKLLSENHSPLFISWARYVAACLIVLPLAIARHGRAFLPEEDRGAHLLRTIFMVAAMVCYFLAIARIPLATAISAYFVGPIIAMALAVVLLGEKLTITKIVSLLLGFAGTMIILQPSGGLDPALLWALAAGGFFALYMIATRHAAQRSDPLKTLAFQCSVGVMMLLPQAIWTWSPLSLTEIGLFLAMGVFSATSHALSISAFRHAQASILAPLVYIELLGSVAIGYLLFGDVPGASVWIGAIAIVTGGVLLVRRQS